MAVEMHVPHLCCTVSLFYRNAVLGDHSFHSLLRETDPRRKTEEAAAVGAHPGAQAVTEVRALLVPFHSSRTQHCTSSHLGLRGSSSEDHHVTRRYLAYPGVAAWPQPIRRQMACPNRTYVRSQAMAPRTCIDLLHAEVVISSGNGPGPPPCGTPVDPPVPICRAWQPHGGARRH